MAVAEIGNKAQGGLHLKFKNVRTIPIPMPTPMRRKTSDAGHTNRALVRVLGRTMSTLPLGVGVAIGISIDPRVIGFPL